MKRIPTGCETFIGSETLIFTPVSLDLNMYALCPGVIAVYLWLARCELESGGRGNDSDVLSADWVERECPAPGSIHLSVLKLASLLIYLCLNWAKEPNTLALRTFLANTRKKWHASLFWRESWIKYECLGAIKGYIYVQWGWFMEMFWSYNVHIDFFYFGKMWPRQMLSLRTSSQSWKVLKVLLCKGPLQRYMLNIESEKRGGICLKYGLWNRQANRMDVRVMLLLRQFAVMAYEANRVKLRGL